ncbi:hypothetical protein TVAG_005530 [Trichomonas vaginalis G3]|uniref:DUF3447 domain-containing protein n=1 Tax=Trichomonas vaginalis (strain ATCC PRA-98 / G3) TaxID=412133 RepID=A2ENT3_TRIV3|nr:spectrin binding [Trichomonas vaginalis G3]EAY05709.1 hypothetical protein TVAG_005530 [Trichomonas vaginalis G3]KAI5506889.1 spectrin binding [Trichomonas vaginalis G3]|eukprot:XP_001317932.1 hypothetical protein [Trichomonas vaginalis G3]
MFDDNIVTYDKLYHIKSNESIDEVFALIEKVLISKYKTSSINIVLTILEAIRYNYRSINIYIDLLKRIITKYPIPSLPKEQVETAKYNGLILSTNPEEICLIDRSLYEQEENEIMEIIAYDQIDKFKEYTCTTTKNRVFSFDIPYFKRVTLLEGCAYFGSVNIFMFLFPNSYKAPETFECAIMGGNTDIINECLKHDMFYYHIVQTSIECHNNQFLEYVLEMELVNIREYWFMFQPIFTSTNLKALFLMYNKYKEGIAPCFAEFPQLNDIIKNKIIDFTSNIELFLEKAIHHNNFEMVNFFIDYYKENNSLSDSILEDNLFLALFFNRSEIAKFLVSLGAKLNDDIVLNDEFIDAVRKLNEEIAKLLISIGADVNLEIDDYHSYLHKAVLDNDSKRVALLVKLGANINSKDEDRNTPLHLAIMERNYNIVDLLISHGADLEAKGENGLTPLQLAEAYIASDIVQLLISKGTNVDAK